MAAQWRRLRIKPNDARAHVVNKLVMRSLRAVASCGGLWIMDTCLGHPCIQPPILCAGSATLLFYRHILRLGDQFRSLENLFNAKHPPPPYSPSDYHRATAKWRSFVTLYSCFTSLVRKPTSSHVVHRKPAALVVLVSSAACLSRNVWCTDLSPGTWTGFFPVGLHFYLYDSFSQIMKLQTSHNYSQSLTLKEGVSA